MSTATAVREPWCYVVKKNGKDGGETIVFRFQGSDYARQEWYPPWQNDLQRDNAESICADLNAAFKRRTEAQP